MRARASRRQHDIIKCQDNAPTWRVGLRKFVSKWNLDLTNKLSDLGHCSLVIARTSHPETMMTPAVHYWWLLITHDDWEERSFFVWSCILVNGAETRGVYTSETLDKWTGACKLETTKYPSRSLEHFMLCKYLIIVEMFSCHPLLPSSSPLYLISAQILEKQQKHKNNCWWF